MKTTARDGMPALALMEEAFHLVRRAPLSALGAYYTGSLPFILGLYYFWSEMCQRMTPDEACARAAVGMAALFVWMKCWQTVYGQRLFAEVMGEEPAPWNIRRAARMAVTQAILQPVGFITLPFALLALVPFAWAYALFQNITVLGNGDEPVLRVLVRRCARLAALWSRQNHFAIWMLSPVLLVVAGFVYYGLAPLAFAALPSPIQFLVAIPVMVFSVALILLCPLGMLVVINLTSALATLPMLLRTLFGVETTFSLIGHNLFSPVFSIIVYGLAYLLLDPLMKAVYVLRCFYGESSSTGDDLKVELRRYARVPTSLRAVLIGAAMLTLCGTARAADNAAPVNGAAQPAAQSPAAVSPDALDRAIAGVLEQREYAWRLPKNRLSDGEKGLLVRFVEAVRDTLVDWMRAVYKVWRRFKEWLQKHEDEVARDRSHDDSLFQWRNIAETLLYLLLAGLILVAIAMSWRAWRTRVRVRTDSVQLAPAPAPDIEDDGVLASALPESEWLALARDLIAKGDYRLALRALFLASLANLAQREFIRIAKFKSNRDYQRELARRAHTLPIVTSVFAEQTDQFERVWYGAQEATRDHVDQFLADQERIRIGAA